MAPSNNSGDRPTHPSAKAEEQAFTRSFDALPSLYTFIEDFFESAGIDPTLMSSVQLSAEELFTNMVKYNAEEPRDILVRLAAVDHGIRVSLVDHEKKPFDITKVKPAAIDQPIEERPIGKLGIHLVRTMVDTLDFEHVDGRSTITFTKGPE